MRILSKKLTIKILVVFLLLIILWPVTVFGGETEFTQEELDYIKENPSVITAVDPAFTPFEFIDNDGEYKGIAADYLKLIEVKTGLSFKILEGLSWPEAYDLALKGDVDLLPCVGITKERENYFLFTDGYLKFQRAVLSLSDGPIYKFKDLEKVVVGVQRNSSHYSYITYETDIEPVLYEDVESLLFALSVGEIDAVIANYASAKYTANQLGITNIKADEIIDSETTELAMAVHRENVILMSILNKALRQISEEQSISIQAKWLGIEKEADYSRIYLYLIIGVSIAVVIILIFIYWNRTLKKHKDILKASSEKFRIIADYTYDWETWFSNEGKLLWTNPAVERMTGYSVKECYDNEDFPLILFFDDDLTRMHEMFSRAMNGFTGNDEVFKIRKKDGGMLWGAFSWNPVFKKEGEMQGFRASVRNFTERKKQEEEIKKALEKVNTLYDASQALRGTMNLTEVFKIILNRLKEVVNYDTAAIEEIKDNDLKIIHCEGFDNPEQIIGTQFPIVKGTFVEKLATGKIPFTLGDIREHGEFIDMSEGKTIRSFMGVPLVMNDEVIGALTIDSKKINFFDDEMITTVTAFASQAAIALNNAKNYKDLQIAKEAAETATKAKGDFLANMSHEIRTPMNAVIGLNSLLDRTNLNDKQKDYVNKIGISAKNLLNIINDILDFSKIESGRLAIEQIDFNLEEVLDNLSNVLALKAYERGIELVISKDKDVPTDLVGDPLRLGQVLLNLSNNSIKFTAKGEVVIKVEKIKKVKDKLILRFSVQDSGIGMTSEQVSNLFQEFKQADASTTRKYGGTGLGLSISKNLVNLMDGEIGVESEYGKGSTFYFTSTFMLSKVKVMKRDIISSGLKDLRILIVEDNEYAREVLSTYLEGFTYEPALAASGEEAINDIQNAKEPYDLVLMDWKMPGLNGIETWKQIKKVLGDKPHPKVILVTAYGKDELFSQAKKEGFNDFLTKPVSQSTLFNAIIRPFSDGMDIKEEKSKSEHYPDGFEQIRGARILLVEDNEVNQQVAGEILEIEGFWVDIADNGQIAVDKILENNNYDIVLMDLQMPVLDGYGASRKLREELKITKLPIVALSAEAMSGTRENVLDAGMDDFIAKPIDKTELFGALVKWIKPGEREVQTVNLVDDFIIEEDKLKELMVNIDVEDGLERISGNMDLYLNILGTFKKNNANFGEELRGLIADNKAEDSNRLVHTLKGVSGNIGAKTLNYLVINLEKQLKGAQPNNDDVESLLNEIDGELIKITSQISKVLKIIENKENAQIGTQENMSTEKLLEKLTELIQALDIYDAEASIMIKDIKKKASSYNLGVEFNKIDALIEDLEQDEAVEICKNIIENIENLEE